MNEDERAIRLLQPLRGEPIGPSGVDVPRAMAEGRRLRLTRRWSGGLALAAVTAVTAGGGTVAVQAMGGGTPAPTPVHPRPVTTVSPAPALPASCAIHLLPTGGITKALVTGGDPSGHYLAGRVYPPGGHVHTVIWKDGRLQASTPVPGSDADINDLNSAGVGVGDAFDDSDHDHAYVVRNGTPTRLRGGEATATAINEAGVIVGALGELDNGVPARWPSADAAPAKLPLPHGATIGATTGIDEDGTIVGSVGAERGEPSGYLWLADGSHRPMPLPAVGGRKATYFWPDSLSNGWVYGQAVYDSRTARTFSPLRYRIATGAYEYLPAEIGSPALGARNGEVLGVDREGPVIASGTRTIQLPMYGKVRAYIVTSFSDDGRVASAYSTGLDNSGTDNLPFMWTCR